MVDQYIEQPIFHISTFFFIIFFIFWRPSMDVILFTIKTFDHRLLLPSLLTMTTLCTSIHPCMPSVNVKRGCYHTDGMNLSYIQYWHGTMLERFLSSIKKENRQISALGLISLIAHLGIYHLFYILRVRCGGC